MAIWTLPTPTPASGTIGFIGRSRIRRKLRSAQTFLPERSFFFTIRAMESHELLRQVFQKASPKQAAAEMGLSLSMIYKWAEPPDSTSGATNPLDRVSA